MIKSAPKAIMKNIIILISGRGSNMQAIVETAQQQNWAAQIGARVAAVISNRPDAAGLDFARSHGIPTEVVNHKSFPSREAFDAALRACIDTHAPDLIALAGFMRVLTPAFVDHYQGRMLNIHPSLLPAFPGLDTHRRALEAGVAEHGVTVHVVTAALDHGPVVAQARVPVLPGDTEDSLAARVLEREHIIYPQAVCSYIESLH